jgi:hypothetical protein
MDLESMFPVGSADILGPFARLMPAMEEFGRGRFAGQNTEYQGNLASQNLAFGLIAANLQFFHFNQTNGNLTAAPRPTIADPSRVEVNTFRYFPVGQTQVTY